MLFLLYASFSLSLSTASEAELIVPERLRCGRRLRYTPASDPRTTTIGMDHQHGNPLNGGNRNHLSQSPSPQSHTYQGDINPANLGLGISQGNLHERYPGGQLLSADDLPIYDANLEQNQQYTQGNLGEPLYALSQNTNIQSDFQPQFDNSQSFGTQQFNYNENFLDESNYNAGDFPLYSNSTGQNDHYDPSLFLNDAPQQSINPADLIADMSSPQNHTPTPPQMLQPELPQTSSAQHSPSFNQQQFPRSPGHSRNASLQPESAQFPNAHLQTDWGMLAQQFRSHRRTPSEYSDVSASSAAHSPNLGLHDSFDNGDQRHSPQVVPQDQSIYQDLRGIGNFSLSDSQAHHGTSPLHGRSPAHSPIPSPRLGPLHIPMNQMNQQSPFMLNMNMPNNTYIHNASPDLYGLTQEQYNDRNDCNEIGQAQQMPPPDINIVLAPVSRQNSFEPPKPATLDQDALTPPQRGKAFSSFCWL